MRKEGWNAQRLDVAWNPETYLQFEKERTLPSRDLASRIELDAPSRIADLGCGPGMARPFWRRGGRKQAYWE